MARPRSSAKLWARTVDGHGGPGLCGLQARARAPGSFGAASRGVRGRSETWRGAGDDCVPACGMPLIGVELPQPLKYPPPIIHALHARTERAGQAVRAQQLSS